MADTLVLGAVAYDAKVVTIWDGFTRWFAAHGLDFDYVLYSNYERQVEQHFAGAFDVAWNSPLAWLQAEAVARARGRRVCALAMRDTDQDLASVVLVRAEDAIHDLADLRGRTIGVGASDSPQATLIPLLHLAENGIEPGVDCAVRRFDVLVGKHGDHVGGEREAVLALLAGEVDAACLIDGNLLAFSREGTLPAGRTRVLATTARYDHCNFTALDDGASPKLRRFAELLLGMRYADPSARPLMDLEGLKAWRPGRTGGYALLARACARFGSLAAFLARMRVA
jgi:phosphonate transport system substrate-binding protein